MIELAAKNGAGIVAMPELAFWPWFPAKIDKQAFHLAEPADGPIIETTCKIAAEFSVAIICPLFESDPKGTFFNSAVTIDAKGSVLGKYRKAHVPQLPSWEEKFYFAAGDNGFPVFSACSLNFGVLIGWDAFFPEAARALTLSGAKLIFYLTAATSANQDVWERALSAMALYNGNYIIRVNRTGGKEPSFGGGSFGMDPLGELLDHPANDQEGVMLFSIHTDAVDLHRKEWPFIRDRRPDAYRVLVESEMEKREGTKE